MREINNFFFTHVPVTFSVLINWNWGFSFTNFHVKKFLGVRYLSETDDVFYVAEQMRTCVHISTTLVLNDIVATLRISNA